VKLGGRQATPPISFHPFESLACTLTPFAFADTRNPFIRLLPVFSKHTLIQRMEYMIAGMDFKTGPGDDRATKILIQSVRSDQNKCQPFYQIHGRRHDAAGELNYFL
jgi:hypothetical protein